MGIRKLVPRQVSLFRCWLVPRQISFSRCWLVLFHPVFVAPPPLSPARPSSSRRNRTKKPCAIIRKKLFDEVLATTATIVLTFALALFLSGCTSVFYQPSRQLFDKPETYNLTYKDVFFESIDGTPLHGWWFPHKKDQAHKGTFLLLHGNAENLSSFFVMMAWVVAKGYDLFVFDYRGYGRSDGEPDPAGVNFDAIAALLYVQNLWIKKETPRVIAYGQSIGGAILLRALPQINDKSFLKAVVIDSSFVDYKKLAREKLAGFAITWPLQWLANILVSNEYSPRESIPLVSPLPLLVIHGTNDPIVPLHHGEEIFSLAREPKTFWKIEGGSHIDSMVRHKGVYRDQLLHFLNGIM